MMMGTRFGVPTLLEDEGRKTKDEGKTFVFRHSSFVFEKQMQLFDTRPRVTGIVLAGGKSRRMGRDKAWLNFDGVPLIARVVTRVQRVCAETLIVADSTDAYAHLGVRVVGDVYPRKGSLGGIFAGLQAAQEKYVLAVACDMPFLNDALMRYLISLAPQADVVIPRAHAPTGKAKTAARYDQLEVKESGLQAMHAVYSKRCLEPMRARLLANDLRIINFFDEVRVRVVEPDEVAQFDPQFLSFFNVNTPEDWQSALLLDERRKTKDE